MKKPNPHAIIYPIQYRRFRVLDIKDCVSSELYERYQFYNYNHALEILTTSFAEEWGEIQETLEQFYITTDDLRKQGGNETDIPKKFDFVLYPHGWREIRISGDMIINFYPRKGNTRGRFESSPNDRMVIEGYIDGHNIDFLKNRVAFDLEWNSKDQTFDRDLLAMRTYYDCDIISVGIIVTRSEDLNDVFRTVYAYNNNSRKYAPILPKYGASTTHIDKLLYRLDSRRNGGCPILAIGITKKCVSDWKEGYIDANK